ncbi:MAG: HEAT repeat domain-containing protein [Nostocaceae cyanobacterium]|nr:HEAT repeat domain-containing protein [Nostocaceae cyanobacterium]
MSVTPESVKQLLSSEDFGDRLRAVNQIRQLEAAIGFELLQTAIKDSNTRVRYSAVSQMDTLGGQNLELAYSLLRDRLLNDKEPDVQAAAADCLGALKLQSAFEDLQQLYHTTSEWVVQFSIIAALGELGDPRGFELLKQALDSETELVQTAAISSLGELGNQEAIPLLAGYVTNPDWQIRYRVVQALSCLGGVEANALLAQLAGDEVESVAQSAKMGLQST